MLTRSESDNDHQRRDCHNVSYGRRMVVEGLKTRRRTAREYADRYQNTATLASHPPDKFHRALCRLVVTMHEKGCSRTRFSFLSELVNMRLEKRTSCSTLWVEARSDALNLTPFDLSCDHIALLMVCPSAAPYWQIGCHYLLACIRLRDGGRYHQMSYQWTDNLIMAAPRFGRITLPHLLL